MKKRGALELSVGTMVVIVLAMVMLILGFVLVTKIFSGATDSVDTLNDKVKSEINKLFTDQSETVVIYLGSDRTAKVRADTQNFGVAIGARTESGEAVESRARLKYTLTLDKATANNCVSVLGEAATKALFSQTIGTSSQFDEYGGDAAYARVIINVPAGTSLC